MGNYLGICIYGMFFIRNVPEDIKKLSIEEFDVVCERETKYLKNELKKLGFRPKKN